MSRIFENIKLDLLPALRATLEDLGIRPERLARGPGETQFIQVHAKGDGMAARRKVISALRPGAELHHRAAHENE